MRKLIRETAEPPPEQAAAAAMLAQEPVPTLPEVEEAPASSVKSHCMNKLEPTTEERDNHDSLIVDDGMFCGIPVDIFGDHTGNQTSGDEPSQRYFINRLYQPMNGSPAEEPEPEALADDEYLFYQELRFFESTVQELTGGCGAGADSRVSFSKILEEDEEGDDVSRLCDEIERQQVDEEADLHLTTIIDSFQSQHHSFHANHHQTNNQSGACTPPLIESSSDPMMTEACHAEKPDSSTTTHETHLVVDRSLHHQQLITTPADQQHQFMCNTSHNNSAGSVEEHSMSHIQESNSFMGTDVEEHLTHHQEDYETPQHHLQHFHDNQLIEDQQQQQHQMAHSTLTLDDSGSLQQQVSSSFGSSSQNALLSDSSFSSTLDSGFGHQLQNNSQTSHLKQQVVTIAGPTNEATFEASSNEAGKRYLDEAAPKRSKKLRCASIQQQHSPSTTKVTSSNNYGPNSIKDADYSPLHSSSSFFRLNEEEDHTTSDGDYAEEEGADTGKQPPQMVKYRRRTANARERIRMREINQAFEKLKKVVPVELIHTVSSAGDESDASIRRTSKSVGAGPDPHHKSAGADPQSVKLTKITTLRLAVSYISKLSELLQQQEGGNSPIVISSTADHQVGASSKSSSGSARRRSGTDKRGSSSGRKGATGRAAKQSHDKSLRRRGSKFNSNEESQLETTQLPVQGGRPSVAATRQACPQKLAAQNFILATTNGAAAAMQQVATTNGLQLKQHQPATLQMMQTTYCSSQQPQLAISQQTPTNQQANIHNHRTFVTPVAVAILGIQTTGNQQRSSTGGAHPNEPQALQLVGLHQTGNQLHHQRAHHHQQQQQQQSQQHLHQPTYYTQQAPQASSVGPHQQQQYNLISSPSQPQQLTFTLNGDMSGLSVLRLASTKGGQLQCQPIVQHQQQQSVLGNYANYATYQPVRISQATAACSPALVSSSGAELQTGNDTQLDLIPEPLDRNNETLGAKIIISEGQQIETSNQSVAIGSSCNTGKISGFHQFESQQQNNNSNRNNNVNLIQAYEVKPDQRSLAANGGAVLAVAAPTGEQVMQQQQQATGGLDWLYRPQPSHIIYLSPSSLSRGGKQTAHLQQLQVSQQVSTVAAAPPNQQPPNHTAPRAIVQVGDQGDRCAANPQPAELQFATNQFSSQPTATKLRPSQEANIRQLVASLTTSIHPRTSGDSGNRSQAPAGGEEQRQQLKRTYRFHNYDGTMITNHLYGSSHHNHNQQQQQSHESHTNKQQRGQQASEHQHQTTAPSSRGGAQRSRLNSLSSTCSATSSSSSLMSGGAGSSPAAEVVAIKSPGEGSTPATVSS